VISEVKAVFLQADIKGLPSPNSHDATLQHNTLSLLLKESSRYYPGKIVGTKDACR